MPMSKGITQKNDDDLENKPKTKVSQGKSNEKAEVESSAVSPPSSPYSSSGVVTDAGPAEDQSSPAVQQCAVYPDAVNVAMNDGFLQHTSGYINSPLYTPYQQAYQGHIYPRTYQDWMSQGLTCYAPSVYSDSDLMNSPTHATFDQQRFSYQYGSAQVSPILPFAASPDDVTSLPTSPLTRRSSGSFVRHQQHYAGRHNTNFVNRRNLHGIQHLGYAPLAPPDIAAVYSHHVPQTVSTANAIALAQVAQQAAIQTSSKYNSASSPGTSIAAGSLVVQPAEISPEVRAKIAAGKPIPHPVPSLFAAPTFEEALGSSLYNPNNTRNVYIRGLPPDTTDASLVDICERFGAIESSKAIVDTQTEQCKGFGFVLFVKEDDATSCISGLIYYGYQVSFAKESFSTRLKNLQDPDSTNLYLSNLPLNMHEKDLEALFQPYKVISNRILRDSNNVSRGVGFARMSDRESAEAIIENFDNTPIGDDPDGPPLQVRFADSQSQKRLKAVTQRRRQWRAREYNILTQGVDQPMMPGLLTAFDPTISVPLLQERHVNMSSFQGQAGHQRIAHSYPLLMYDNSAKPRTMPEVEMRSRPDAMEDLPKDNDDIVLKAQMAQKLVL